MKCGAARGSSRSSAPPSCSNVAQPVSDFDSATAEIVAAVKLLPRQKPPASPPFHPVRAARALIRAGRTAASNETAVRPSVGGLTDVVYPIRGAGEDSGALSVKKKNKQSRLSTPPPAQVLALWPSTCLHP